MNDIELLQILLIPIGKKRGGREKEKVIARRKKGRGTGNQKKRQASHFYGQSSKIILTFCRVLYKLDRATRRLAC